MLRQFYRILVLMVGLTVLLIGVAMLVLPGPAVVVIPVGLAILATEFAWARHWLHIIRQTTEKGAEKLNLRFFLARKGAMPSAKAESSASDP